MLLVNIPINQVFLSGLRMSFRGSGRLMKEKKININCACNCSEKPTKLLGITLACIERDISRQILSQFDEALSQ